MMSDIKFFENQFERIIVSFAQVLTVACTADLEAIKRKYNREDSQRDTFALASLDLYEVVSDPREVLF